MVALHTTPVQSFHIRAPKRTTCDIRYGVFDHRGKVFSVSCIDHDGNKITILPNNKFRRGRGTPNYHTPARVIGIGQSVRVLNFRAIGFRNGVVVINERTGWGFKSRPDGIGWRVLQPQSHTPH